MELLETETRRKTKHKTVFVALVAVTVLSLFLRPEADCFAVEGAPAPASVDAGKEPPVIVQPPTKSPQSKPLVHQRPLAVSGKHLTTEDFGKIVKFNASAFPYDGPIPEQNKDFLDVVSGERRGHTSPRGGVLWADQTYNKQDVLLYVPKNFDSSKPAVIIVFFHGNLAMLERDVKFRQHVPRQLLESGLNAVLVAPQLAVNALDSSAGHFWDADFFRKFLDEAAEHLAKMQGGSSDQFKNLPVIIVAYSGGYLPAIFSAQKTSGAAQRIRGIILLDALFGEFDKYADWIGDNRANAFFFSAYSPASAAANESLCKNLKTNGVRCERSFPATLQRGSIYFLAVGDSSNHNDFVTHAWTKFPLKDVLERVEGYRRVPLKSVPAVVGEERSRELGHEK
ncbi:MAG: alpha/beta hydrolase [Beijerinckiaceae bacterium]